MKDRIKKMVALAMLSAMAYIMVVLSRFIPLKIMFLQYDPKDVIITLGGLIYGPLAAFIISAIASLIEMITISQTGYWGLIMNILSTCAFACTASAIYRKKRTLSGACLGLIAGIAAMSSTMMLWNYLIAPIYMGTPREEVVKLLVPVFLPFNLLKASINAALTYLLYKPLITALRKSGFVASASVSEKGKKSAAPIILMSAAIILLAIGIVLFIFIG